MSFLLDTDISSAYLRGNRQLFNKFLQHTGQLNLSTIVLGELLTWAYRKKAPPSRSQTVDSFLKDVTILDVNFDVATRFAHVQAYLLDNGKPKGRSDLFIAATALVHDLTLVTHNRSHFIDVPGLRIDDWLES